MATNRTFHGIVSYLAVLLWFFTPLAPAHEDEAADMDIRDFVRNSEFVFKGLVEQIDYRISEPITIIDPETGLPDFADGSNLPHAFVRLFIERIYKGKVLQLLRMHEQRRDSQMARQEDQLESRQEQLQLK